MYTAIYCKNGDLKHSQACTAAFGRKDSKCPRCVEMLNGAPARDSWHKDYKDKQNAEAARVQAIHNHICDHKCGAVCTKFEW